MSRNQLFLIVGAVGIILIGAIAYAVLGPTEEASAPIEAIPIAQEPTNEPEPTPEPEPTATPEPDPTEEPIAEEVEMAEEADTEEPTPEPDPTAEPMAEEVTNGPITYEIVQSESEARFELDEDLRGEPITVIGVTDQVAAQLLLDPNDLSTAQIGVVSINARTLVTDADRRNQAIRNRILLTDQFEFITFEPANLVGLPDSVAEGDSAEFQIEGNLTIRDVTLPVIFDAVVTYTGADRIEGSAASIVLYADYGLVVPDLPFIANVEDELEIYLDFVATPIE